MAHWALRDCCWTWGTQAGVASRARRATPQMAAGGQAGGRRWGRSHSDPHAFSPLPHHSCCRREGRALRPATARGRRSLAAA